MSSIKTRLLLEFTKFMRKIFKYYNNCCTSKIKKLHEMHVILCHSSRIIDIYICPFFTFIEGSFLYT